MTFIAIALSIAWISGFWHLTKQRKTDLVLLLNGVIASGIAVALAAPNLWIAFQHGYPQDSFFTLSTFGRTGVLTISVISIALLFFILSIKTKWILQMAPSAVFLRISVALLDCLVSMGLFGVFFSASPQIYYTFYRVLIPDLPQQIVIKSLYDLDKLILIAQLPVSGTLSQHLSGIVFWAIVPFTFWLHAKFKK